MSLWQLLNILKARWKIALSVLGVSVLAVAIVSLLMPRKYTAEASIVVDVKTPDPISGAQIQVNQNQTYVATQVDVVKSPRVAHKVIDELKLADDAKLKADWQKTTRGQGLMKDWVAATLLTGLKVTPSRESNVMTVEFTSPNAQTAATMANAFAQAYLDTTLELRVEPARKYSEFFQAQVKGARDALETAQAKLSAYQQGKGILVTDERLDVENTHLSDLTQAMVVAQAAAVETNSRSGEAARNGSALLEVTSNPVITSLKSQLALEEAKLSDMRQRYGEAHPAVVASRATIAELQSRINSETGTLASGVAQTARVNQSRVAQLKAAIEEQRAKVLKMRADRDDAGVLLRDVENAQKAYDAIVSRANQSSLESQTQLSAASVLSPAVMPLLPSSPKVLLNLAVAGFAGTILAVLTALVMELLDRRMRGPEDVVAAVGLHVIGALPKPGGRLGHSRRGLLLANNRERNLALPAPQAGGNGSAGS